MKLTLPDQAAEEWITRVAVYGLLWFRSMENLLDTFIAPKLLHDVSQSKVQTMAITCAIVSLANE